MNRLKSYREVSKRVDRVKITLGILRIGQHGDGLIRLADTRLIVQSMGKFPTDDELKGILNRLSIYENIQIDFTEIQSLFQQIKNDVETEEKLSESFKVFDRDGDGFLTRQDLFHVLEMLGEEPTDDDLDGMMQEADRDGDGRISYSEFVRMMIIMQ
jgi:calmodulin